MDAGAERVRVKGMAVAMLAVLVGLGAAPLAAQEASGTEDPLIRAARDASDYVRHMVTASAERMTEDDYTFRPAPEVRSFGELLMHIADSNYLFCAAATREAQPVQGLERTVTARGEMLRVLAESFAYCDAAYASLTGAAAHALVPFMGETRPALAVLLFRTHHGTLHYGNLVTYMRMRGRVPPSSEQAAID